MKKEIYLITLSAFVISFVNCRSVVSSKSVGKTEPGINVHVVNADEKAEVKNDRTEVVIDPGTFDETVYIEVKPLENFDEVTNKINKEFVEAPIEIITKDAQGNFVKSAKKEIIIKFFVADKIPKQLLLAYIISKNSGVVTTVSNDRLTFQNRDDGYMEVSFGTKEVNAIFVLAYDPGVLAFENVPQGISNAIQLAVNVLGGDGYAFYYYKVREGDAAECRKSEGYSSKISINVPITDQIDGYADGQVVLCAFGEDYLENVGNSDSAVSAVWTKDGTSPILNSFVINEGNPEHTNSKTVTLIFDASMDIAQYRVNTDSDCTVFNEQTAWAVIPENKKPSFSLSDDGLKTVCLQVIDEAGNVSNVLSDTIYLDETVPLLSITSDTPYGPSATKNLTGTAFDVGSGMDSVEINIVIKQTGQNITTKTFQNMESWSVNLETLMIQDGTYQVTATAKDKAANIVSTTKDFIWDSGIPTIATLQIDSGATSTTKYMVKIDLGAADSFSNITHFCLKYNDETKPAANATCWISVKAAMPSSELSPTLTLSSYDYMIGFIPGTYLVTAWVRDVANNMSNYSGVVGVDKKSIDYNPGTPPVITDVIVANSDAPANPPSIADRTIVQNADVFIKWRVYDDRALPANPISLFFTTDDNAYSTIVENIPYNNEANGCTINNPGTAVDDNATGCYRWVGGSPSNGYFKIRVAAKDSNGMITFAPSSPINEDQIDLWAGNTEQGLGASASAAVFIDARAESNMGNPGTLVITTSGTFYVRDSSRGILYISPVDGVLKTFIPKGATSTGDGGPISLATVSNPRKIALDYEDRLLIYDGNKIRRVDTHADPMTIDTIIGGGSSTAATVAAKDIILQVSNSFSEYEMTFTPLPDGRLVFQADSSTDNFPVNGFHLGRLYHPDNNGQVSSIDLNLNSIGHEGNTTTLIKNCALWQNIGIGFNPDTSTIDHLEVVLRHSDLYSGCEAGGSGFDYYYSRVSLNPVNYSSLSETQPSGEIGWLSYVSYITSRNGQLYALNRYREGIYKLDKNTGVWSRIIGTEKSGSCQDGTPALSCAIDPLDIFITRDERIFFVERGKIRTVDSSGNVISIFGQGLTFGDGGTALSARFGVIDSIVQKSDGTVILLDSQEKRFREVSSSLMIQHIAGNSVDDIPDTTNLAANQPIHVNWNGAPRSQFSINPTNGDIFFKRGWILSRLDRASGKWIDVAGGGATKCPIGDNETSIYFPYMPPFVIGFGDNKVLAATYNYDATTGKGIDALLKLYNLSDSNRQSHFLGTVGDPATTPCASGTLIADCGVLSSFSYQPHVVYDNLGGRSRWVFYEPFTTFIRAVSVADSTISTIATLPRAVLSFAPKFGADLGTTNFIYYCAWNAGAKQYKLYQYNINTSSETLLDWPIASMTCGGSTLIYDATDNSLIFPFRQNGLSGIAEYKL